VKNKLNNKSESSPLIVILAYNRPDALSRLLKSIRSASYPKVVELMISLEGGASKEVKKIAYAFSSPMLQVKVVQREERLGLRKHVLACADLALEYGAVIVLEDDLLVDRYFYQYATAALKYYDSEGSIAGIALYSHEYNEYAELPFKPMGNGYSTYPVQVPCSWGQCWSKDQWKRFKAWYASADNQKIKDTNGLPSVVKNWPESSWKKYFAAYLVSNDLNFIYPYQSYTTNCSDLGGTHILDGTDVHQVCFLNQDRSEPVFEFCPVDAPEVAYDAFFEPSGSLIYRLVGAERGEVDVDTLGIKSNIDFSKKYILTARPVNRSIKEFPRKYRPIESNFSHVIMNNTKGVFSLALKEDCDTLFDGIRTLDYYFYYSGLKISSFKMIKVLFNALPRLFFGKIKRKILR